MSPSLSIPSGFAATFDHQSVEDDPMSVLCAMVVETEYHHLPSSVIRQARYSFLDTMGALIAGTGMDSIPALVDLVKDKGGRPQTVLPFYDGRVPASEAALVLGAMARALDFGDVHHEAGPVSEYIVPSLLAATGLASSRVTGKDFLTALVVGQEVLIRIGCAYRAVHSALRADDTGGHYIFGAVAAIGKLLGFTQSQLEQAQAIARTMIPPHTNGIHSPGTPMTTISSGLACQSAITACLFAQRGFTARTQDTLTGKGGYLSLASWETNPDALLRNLTTHWEMTQLTRKTHAVNAFALAPVSALLDQMATYHFGAHDIGHIHISLSPSAWRVVCHPTETAWTPRSILESQSSLPYAIATAAVGGGVFAHSYSSQARQCPAVRALMRRVRAIQDPFVSDFGARVMTALRDGRTITTSRGYGCGNGTAEGPGPVSSGLSEAGLVAKFRACVAICVMPLQRTMVDELVENILALERVEDVEAVLLLALTGGPRGSLTNL